MNLLQLDLLTQDEEKNFRERAIKVVQAAGGIVLKAHQVILHVHERTRLEMLARLTSTARTRRSTSC
jgi:hypothetical protein